MPIKPRGVLATGAGVDAKPVVARHFMPISPTHDGTTPQVCVCVCEVGVGSDAAHYLIDVACGVPIPSPLPVPCVHIGGSGSGQGRAVRAYPPP